jgi:hypothetical protein
VGSAQLPAHTHRFIILRRAYSCTVGRLHSCQPTHTQIHNFTMGLQLHSGLCREDIEQWTLHSCQPTHTQIHSFSTGLHLHSGLCTAASLHTHRFIVFQRVYICTVGSAERTLNSGLCTAASPHNHRFIILRRAYSCTVGSAERPLNSGLYTAASTHTQIHNF